MQATAASARAGAVAVRDRRATRQAAVWWVLFAVIIAGWWYPVAGLFVPGCMIAAWTIAAFRGRSWCDWMCPRGAFHDFLLARASRGRGIPALLRTTGFRLGAMAVLMTVLTVRISQAWPDLGGIGLAFVTVLTVTTLVGIVLGVIYHQRSWCTVCPAGTVANWISRGRKRPQLLVDDAQCTDCKHCAKVCPLELQAHSYRSEGVMCDGDCTKCGMCVASCPRGALSWEGRTDHKEAA
jgi:ferredoxin-type protein NapH